MFICMKDCPFCNLNNIEHSTKFFNIIYDKYPVSKGHILVISKRHIASYFDLCGVEKYELVEIIDTLQKYLSDTYSPDGFNIGFNDGKCAGQTVQHFHLHIIPRYEGDMENPQGGVRGVIPNKQKYKIEDYEDLGQ